MRKYDPIMNIKLEHSAIDRTTCCWSL